MPFPTPSAPTAAVVVAERRHEEWRRHQLRWRWLLDSWEGGEAYRLAVYGTDHLGMPVRNLIRHKREYPDVRQDGTTSNNTLIRPQGTDQYAEASNDDYTLRLARTPVPTFLSDVVDAHLGKIFAKEIKRESQDARLTEWWEDVDGKGTTIDDWMEQTVAPLLMVLGCLDLIFDHPRAPDGVDIESRADERVNGLDRCVAGYILPENMVDWKLDAAGKTYTECLVCELQEDGSRAFRLWDSEGWTFYDAENKVLGEGTHPYGRPPIVRVFDRKRARYRNVGRPAYEGVAERMREYYNRDSELILSDTTQAHPLLQGPEDYINGDGSIPIGPTWLLPKKKNTQGGSVSYEGFDVVPFPKDGAASIRANKNDLRDEIDRSAGLTKPAGAAGTDGSTVAQSGLAKRLDAAVGNDLLGKIVKTLRRTEDASIYMVSLVLGNGVVDQATVDAAVISYPASFDLAAAPELAASTAEFQAILSAAGKCPQTEGRMLKYLARLMLPGLDDDDYVVMDKEIDDFLAAAAKQISLQAEAMNGGAISQEATRGSADQHASTEPGSIDPDTGLRNTELGINTPGTWGNADPITDTP